MTATKLAGFTEETVAALEAAGWIKGTECGYKHHAGFVHGTREGRSLVASKKPGVFALSTITCGLCEQTSYLTLPEVLAYFG